MSDYFDALEDHLRDAVRRQAHTRAKARWPRKTLRRTGQALPVLTVIAITIAVVVFAAFGLRHRTAPARSVGTLTSTTPSAASAATDARLRRDLAVLRRPQTAADRAEITGHSIFDGVGFGSELGIIKSSVRVARTTPWGQLVVLALTRPPKHKARLSSINAGLFVGVENRGSGGGGGCCSDAANVNAGGDLSTEGSGTESEYRSERTDLTIVVPDGVATVVFVIPRQNGDTYGTPIYRRALRISAPVISNVAAIRVNRACCQGQVPMIWEAADGTTIKRIGNLAAANLVKPEPQPGPPTARSRAAERNPSTPNPVYVTPTTGGPHTQFTFHFRALLNAANYSWTISGPACPRLTRTGGVGDPNLLRGDLASFNTRSISSQAMCPGHYTIAVSTELNQPAHGIHPFGTGTFTVR